MSSLVVLFRIQSVPKGKNLRHIKNLFEEKMCERRKKPEK